MVCESLLRQYKDVAKTLRRDKCQVTIWRVSRLPLLFDMSWQINLRTSSLVYDRLLLFTNINPFHLIAVSSIYLQAKHFGSPSETDTPQELRFFVPHPQRFHKSVLLGARPSHSQELSYGYGVARTT